MCGYAICKVNYINVDVDIEVKWQYCKVILYVGSPFLTEPSVSRGELSVKVPEALWIYVAEESA